MYLTLIPATKNDFYTIALTPTTQHWLSYFSHSRVLDVAWTTIEIDASCRSSSTTKVEQLLWLGLQGNALWMRYDQVCFQVRTRQWILWLLQLISSPFCKYCNECLNHLPLIRGPFSHYTPSPSCSAAISYHLSFLQIHVPERTDAPLTLNMFQHLLGSAWVSMDLLWLFPSLIAY